MKLFDSETNHYRMSLIIVYAFCSLFEIQPCRRCLFCIFWLTQWKLLICSPSAFKRTRHSQMTFKWQIDLTAKNSSKRLFWFTFYMLFFNMCKVIAKWSGQKQNHQFIVYQTFHRGQADYHVDHYDFLVNDHSSCVRINRLMQVIHIPVSLPCLLIRKILMNSLSEYFIRFNLDQYL